MPTIPNFLVIVLDDTSRYELSIYGVDPSNSEAPTRTITNFVAPRSRIFTRAYAKPNCSPWRAAYQTGRYGFHTGVGTLAQFGQRPLSLSETTIAHVMKRAGYATSLIGKWHLSSPSNGNETHPILAGYDWWRGTLRNLPGRGDEDFNHWTRINGERTESGVRVTRERIDRYLTVQQAEDALEWINRQERPWYCCFCLNDPHQPFNRPPPNLYDQMLYQLDYEHPPAGTPTAGINPYFKAKIQACDWAIGRVLRGIPQAVLARTHVVIVADNGTPAVVTVPPFDPTHAKNTVFEEGLNVPLLWMGPDVDRPGATFDGLFKTEDFFPTIAELAGVDLATDWPALALDGISHANVLRDASLGSQQTWVYTEEFSPNTPNQGATVAGQRALIGQRFKLQRFATGVVFPQGTDRFFDLLNDPFETTNLTPGGNPAGLTGDALAAYNQAVADYPAIVNS